MNISRAFIQSNGERYFISVSSYSSKIIRCFIIKCFILNVKLKKHYKYMWNLFFLTSIKLSKLIDNTCEKNLENMHMILHLNLSAEHQTQIIASPHYCHTNMCTILALWIYMVAKLKNGFILHCICFPHCSQIHFPATDILECQTLAPNFA